MSIPSPVPGMPVPPPGDGKPSDTPAVPPQIVPPPGIFAPPPVAPPTVTPTPAATPASTPPPVSAQPWAPLDRPAPPPPADDLDRTIVVARRPELVWTLVVDGGPSLRLTGTRVVLGRRPAGAGEGAEELAIPDATRTLSKVHARLDLVEGVWTVTDLHATNGVLVVGADGSQQLLDPGATAPVVERFVLGRVGMRLVATEDTAR